MSETTARLPQSGAACPHCGAARAPQVSWCTQCFAVLDAPVAPAAAPERTAAAAPSEDLEFELSGWDLAQREAAASREGEPELDPRLELGAAPRTGNAFFAQAAAFGGTPIGKFAIMFGGTALLLGLFLGGLALVGMML